ncbi:MAG: hypothetical protein RMX96_28200 [Nostoc sp. ChiSLP02]|nr:hypothetical protein [Nostoc sp. DedSLP05]MDZ8097351.1 hypothetical protein [Nostoc sp. DedSLP01]MDZ8188722.1 hypothetical protein [Nostoc sp. ChiSLP02]
MESTLFTTLTPNEEVNLSGGKKNPKKNINVKLIAKKLAAASNTVTQTATGGAGGNGGTITIGGGKNSPVVIIKSPISANGGDGGDAINSSDNAVGAG